MREKDRTERERKREQKEKTERERRRDRKSGIREKER